MHIVHSDSTSWEIHTVSSWTSFIFHLRYEDIFTLYPFNRHIKFYSFLLETRLLVKDQTSESFFVSICEEIKGGKPESQRRNWQSRLVKMHQERKISKSQKLDVNEEARDAGESHLKKKRLIVASDKVKDLTEQTNKKKCLCVQFLKCDWSQKSGKRTETLIPVNLANLKSLVTHATLHQRKETNT